MKLSNIILSSIAGTATMTLCMYLLAFLTHKPLKVIKILGTMVTFQTTSKGKLSDNFWAIGIGILVHYGTGIVFALAFFWFWQQGIGQPSLIFGFLAGFLSGLVGALIWKVFFLLHPRPPQTVPLKEYFVSLVIAHIIFGVTVVIVYKWLESL